MLFPRLFNLFLQHNFSSLDSFLHEIDTVHTLFSHLYNKEGENILKVCIIKRSNNERMNWKVQNNDDNEFERAAWTLNWVLPKAFS